MPHCGPMGFLCVIPLLANLVNPGESGARCFFHRCAMFPEVGYVTTQKTFLIMVNDGY